MIKLNTKAYITKILGVKAPVYMGIYAHHIYIMKYKKIMQLATTNN